MRSEEKTILKRIRILEHARESKNVSYTCKYFGISRETFYQWKRAYESGGMEALKSRKRGAKNGTHPSKTPKRIENKILFMRKKYKSL